MVPAEDPILNEQYTKIMFLSIGLASQGAYIFEPSMFFTRALALLLCGGF